MPLQRQHVQPQGLRQLPLQHLRSKTRATPTSCCTRSRCSFHSLGKRSAASRSSATASVAWLEKNSPLAKSRKACGFAFSGARRSARRDSYA